MDILKRGAEAIFYIFNIRQYFTMLFQMDWRAVGIFDNILTWKYQLVDGEVFFDLLCCRNARRGCFGELIMNNEWFLMKLGRAEFLIGF